MSKMSKGGRTKKYKLGYENVKKENWIKKEIKQKVLRIDRRPRG